jgi:uncharacterized protein YbgA (DUF1722 family)/uncharacterized protein YbbK (DUF523 family)
MKSEEGAGARDRSMEEPVLRLGISSCLLGESVRYDGGHKKDLFLINTLGRYVEWVAVCPEVEIGLGTPRDSLRLVGEPEAPRMVAPESGADHTDKMQSWARRRLEELAALKLDGYVLKKNSPSCGLFRVRVYGEKGRAARSGRGIFAHQLVSRLPLLPVEEEGRLHDLRLRENFISRVFAHHRWSRLLEEEPSPGGLVRFHTAHKLTLLSHSPRHYRQMGPLVARAGSRGWDELSADYGGLFMEALKLHGTPGKHTGVMQHLMGFLKGALSSEDKAELLGLIEDYRGGLVPLVVPLTLLRHHLGRHPVPDWVHQQVYLNPYPKELMLKNHV